MKETDEKELKSLNEAISSLTSLVETFNTPDASVVCFIHTGLGTVNYMQGSRINITTAIGQAIMSNPAIKSIVEDALHLTTIYQNKKEEGCHETN